MIAIIVGFLFFAFGTCIGHICGYTRGRTDAVREYLADHAKKMMEKVQ